MGELIENMEHYLIRAVDSGNIQRSPTFQAVFSYTVSTIADLHSKIIFDSGGIDVDKILSNSTPATKKLSIIDAGLYYDVIHGKNKSIASDLVNKWYDTDNNIEIPEKEKATITRIYSEIKTNVHTIQMNYRNAALIEAGIPNKFLPNMRVPFRHANNLRLILPVEKTVVQKVQDYYNDLESETQNKEIITEPIIKLYADLVDVEPLEDVLKGGMETARKQVKYFMDTRHKAIKEIRTILKI